MIKERSRVSPRVESAVIEFASTHEDAWLVNQMQQFFKCHAEEFVGLS